MSSYYGSSSFSASVWLPPEDDEIPYDSSDSAADTDSPVEYLIEEDVSEEELSETDSMSQLHTLYIVRFTQPPPIPGLHWGIYLQAPGDTTGPIYDVCYHERSNTWGKRELYPEYVSGDTLIWQDGRSAERYLGRNAIAYLDDPEQFRTVIDDTPVPIGIGEDDNCQSWVKDVIVNAVAEGIVGEGALDEMQGIPNFEVEEDCA
jgi:hypothetical protein